MSDKSILEEVEFFEEDDEAIITLTDDEGNDMDFVEIACVEYEGEFYAFLQPADEIEDFADDEVAIFKVVEEDEETDMFLPVEDEELLNAVFAKYLRAVEELEKTLDQEEE